MKVCLLSRSNGEGGAFIAANRLYQGLQSQPIDLSMIVGVKAKNDPRIISYESYFDKAWIRVTPILDQLPVKLYRQQQNTVYSLQWLPDRVYPKIEQLQPDIINLHWISAGFLKIETLKQLKQPLVWTLHDMWPFTGGCHYSDNCKSYKQKCGKCPQLGSQKSWDLSRWTWQKKAKNWSALNLTIVTPSHWLADCVRQSSLFRNLPVKVIPNGIDTTIYKPIDQKTARDLLNLPQDKKLILFGSINPTTDKRKGNHLLLEALTSIKDQLRSQNIELVVFGNYLSEIVSQLAVKIHILGQLKDDLSLMIAYNAADVFVAPSLEDNLPNTVMEALACGVPCVAFKIGGMADMIEHQVNGYLAKPYEVSDLARGIVWTIDDENKWHKLSQSARQSVEQKFALDIQSSAYYSLFQQLISSTSHHEDTDSKSFA